MNCDKVYNAILYLIHSGLISHGLGDTTDYKTDIYPLTKDCGNGDKRYSITIEKNQFVEITDRDFSVVINDQNGNISIETYDGRLVFDNIKTRIEIPIWEIKDINL